MDSWTYEGVRKILSEEKQREVVRLYLIDELSQRQISKKCDCHRNTVLHYFKLFSEWLNQEDGLLKTLSGIDEVEFTSYLEGIINSSDWVARPLQTQLIEEVTRAEEEMLKKRRVGENIKTMDIYKWLKEHRESPKDTKSLNEERNLSYSTVSLARKQKESKK